MVRTPSPLRSTAKFQNGPEISPTRIFFFSFYYEMIFLRKISRLSNRVESLHFGKWTENSSYHHFLILFFLALAF